MLLDRAYSRFSNLFDLLNLLIRKHLQIANNVWTVPLVLLLYRLEQETWVPVPSLIAAEQPATSQISL